MNLHQWSFAKQSGFKSLKQLSESAKTSWSQQGWCNKPTKLHFQSVLIRKIFMLSNRYESTAVDRRTWLHVPEGTHWSTSNDTHQTIVTFETADMESYTLPFSSRFKIISLTLSTSFSDPLGNATPYPVIGLGFPTCISSQSLSIPTW